MLNYIRSLFRHRGTPLMVVLPSPYTQPLTEKDRERIRKWLADETTQFVLRAMEARHISAFPAHTGVFVRTANDNQVAVNRLHQIQGWESYRNTLLTLGLEPAEVKQILETYPNQQ